jgi:hypothetical protein
MLYGKFKSDVSKEVLDSLGFTKGMTLVHLALLGLFFLYVILGGLAIMIRNRNYY